MKTINVTLKRIKKFPIFFALFLTALFFTACKDNDDENKIYYYDVYGEGYVYYRDTNLPVKGLEIQLKTGLYGGYTAELFINNPIDTFYTDSKGYYRLHFIKKAYGKYPVEYYIGYFSGVTMQFFYNDSWWLSKGGPKGTIPVETIGNAKTTIQFDTLKLYKE